MTTVDRRKWQRLDHALSVEVQILSTAGSSVSAIGTHLSPDGIFVQLGDPPASDTRVRIRLGNETSGNPKLAAEGVVTNQFAPAQERQVTGIGIYLADAGPSWRKLYALLSRSAV